MLSLYFGNSVTTTSGQSCRVLSIGRDIISVRRENYGVLVNVKVFCTDSRIVAEIEDNEFRINPNDFSGVYDRTNRSLSSLTSRIRKSSTRLSSTNERLESLDVSIHHVDQSLQRRMELNS